jgi:cytochrome b561
VLLRRITALTLLVSFIAMSTSGLLMFVIEKPSFTIQMHPVHKLFGLVMIAAAVTHMTLNFHSLRMHLRPRSGVVTVAVLSVLLVALYAVAAFNRVPPDLAAQMDAAAAGAP